MKDEEAEVCQELCEQGGGPELSFPILFFPVVVSVDVKNHERRSAAESNSGEAVSAVRSSRR